MKAIQVMMNILHNKSKVLSVQGEAYTVQSIAIV